MLDILPTTEVSPRRAQDRDRGDGGGEAHDFQDRVQGRGHGRSEAAEIAFVLQDYYDHPEKYDGIFETYLPHLSVLVNCIFWTPRYPRLVTKDYLRNRWKNTRLKVIGDISCDVDGSIEATVKATDPASPVFVWDPYTDVAIDGWEGNGPVIMAVDILPSELPRDASVYFSNVLKEFIPAIARADYDVDFEHLGAARAHQESSYSSPGQAHPGLRIHGEVSGLRLERYTTREVEHAKSCRARSGYGHEAAGEVSPRPAGYESGRGHDGRWRRRRR